MRELPEFLERGEVARLIPVVKDSQQEDRATSIFLAGMMAVDDFAKCLLGEIGQRLGTRARVTGYTQVVYKKLPSEIKHRPDGLIEVSTGSRKWWALVESKIGNATLNEEQIRDYLQVAKLNGVHAVITLSNQFATLPTHHPLKMSRAIPKGIELFHWSWMHILTQATLLLQDTEFASPEQRYILEEIVRYFQHPSVGVSGFDRMNPEWKDVVTRVQTGASLAKTSDEVMATVASWHQESRDLCLIMSRALGRNVRLKLSRAHTRDAVQRLKDDCEAFTKTLRLSAVLDVPDAAATILVVADLRRRTVTCSMALDAPKDKKTATARTNWLLRQLRDSNSEDILLNARWPKGSPATQAALEALRVDPKQLETAKTGLSPTGFEVLMVRYLAGKFSGRRTFIELLESVVPQFYEQVGQHLHAWVAPAPKIEPREAPEEQQADVVTQKPVPAEQVPEGPELDSDVSEPHEGGIAEKSDS